MSYFWNFAAAHNVGWELIGHLSLSTVKASLLFGLAAVCCLAFRRFSAAATRHSLWISALSASLLLPFLSMISVWELPILPSHLTPDRRVDLTETAASTPFNSVQTGAPHTLVDSPMELENLKLYTAPQPKDTLPDTIILPEENVSNLGNTRQQSGLFVLPSDWILLIWLVGVTALLCRLLIGFAATGLLARRATRFGDAALNELFSSLLAELNLKRKVSLLRSETTLMPIVCGVWKPAVLLPAGAVEWSAERQRMVLLHELTHVGRRDCATQALAQVACAVYWFNPLVWYAARRLRVEREQACDDYVLSVGTKPSDYAHHLLEIARSLQGRSSAFEWSRVSTVAMARKSQLEGRLQAILSKESRCRAASRLMSLGVASALCAVFVTLALIRPIASRAQEDATPKVGAFGATKGAEETPSKEFSADGAVSKNEVRTNETNSPELAVKQENNDLNGQPKLKSADPQIDADNERDVESDANSDVEKEVAADAAEVPGRLLVSDAKPPVVDAEPVSFVNAEMGQERKAERQDRNGDYIDEMASVGYTKLTVDELVNLKTHGVTAAYVRGWQAAGYNNLTAKELASLRIHGVTPAFVESMRSLGFADLDVRTLTNLRIHNVTPDFVNRIRGAGYGNLTGKQLIDFRIYNITPEYIAAMRTVGLANLAPRELTSLRTYGVTPEFVRQARSRLGDLTVRQIVELKRQGIIKESNED